MSARSTEWYADPDNRERRKARMRAYGAALAVLGRAHAEERRAAYRQAVNDGVSPGTAAQGAANRVLRAKYPDEFRRIYEEKLTSDEQRQAQGPDPQPAQ